VAAPVEGQAARTMGNNSRTPAAENLRYAGRENLGIGLPSHLRPYPRQPAEISGPRAYSLWHSRESIHRVERLANFRHLIT